ncbi:MAG: helix-turn-helix domain-containing protein [Chitinophaga sp.]|uniref:GlxA family transcriptional regulator n=1 Tax=Chitinophaga sp. TaxID=1869181 RepID=UPI001B09BD03|nr:helix-turn-helix domain-containing protein [Chitinophaga sp.]MBO9730292.1 helix-turn-helix domain-containing protein [Chitinophaga sp.]
MKHVTIVVPSGDINLSSITGSFEILKGAHAYWQAMGNPPLMEIHIAGFVKELKVDHGFFSVRPSHLGDIHKTDLLIIPSVDYDDELIQKNGPLINWIKTQYKGGAEIASMCSGAFLLASTGLLDGKSCATHWRLSANFSQLFPNVQLQPDHLITAEQRIYTNGGGYSFLNLILYLVEIYFDRATAIYCSKIFQIDIERSSQSPFRIFQVQKNHGDELITQAQTYIEENLGERISFEQLASKLATSRRNFDRRFIKATGNTPVEYLQRVKVEVAKSTLEKSNKSVLEVMIDVGYSDEKAFREVFKKITGLSPLDYKEKFHKTTAEMSCM